MADATVQPVATILHEAELAGATLSLLRVLPLMEARGWRFSFWVPGRGPAEQELRRRGYEVVAAERLMRFSLGSLRRPPGAARRLRSVPAYLRGSRQWLRQQHGAALIHANSILSVPEVVSRPASGPPLVLHTHEVLPSGIKGRAAAVMTRRADAVITVSRAAADALLRHGIAASVVYGAAPDPGRQQRRRNDGPLVVGTLATVSKGKGSDLFLAAARRAGAQRDGIEFRMVGNLVVGGEREWAEGIVRAAARSGVRHNVGVDIHAELAGWDIFVLPSRMDAFPLVVLEAMTMGLPVVGADVGGIPEQLADGAGLLVAPENPEQLSEAILRLAGSPEMRASLGEAGRDRVKRLFTLERQADGLDRVYRGLVAAREPL